MRIPMWLTLGVASLVIIFGLYRIRMFFRNAEEEQRARQRKGMFSLAGRTHFLIGIIYLLLGGALVATTFGWNPLAGTFGTSEPAKPAGKGAPGAPGGKGASGTPGAPSTPARPGLPVDSAR